MFLLAYNNFPFHVPEHGGLETGLQNCAQKMTELLTGVDSELGGGIQAEMSWDNFQTGHQEQVSGWEECWEPS